MGHDHGHDHAHTGNKRVLLIAFSIITVFMIVEVVGGYLTNSLALLADAGHMLSDSASLAISLVAFKLGERAASGSKTFGYRRFEILAAVINGVALIGISLYIFYEAIRRFTEPTSIASTGMLIVSVIGLLVNLLVAWIMLRGGDVKENLNMKGAYLHVLSDTLGSIGAIAAALLIMFFGWNWADPLASIIVALLVLRSGYFVTKSAVNILMEGVPENVDLEEITATIQETNRVDDVHDLHVWAITSGLNALSCHVVTDGNMSIAEGETLLQEIKHKLEDQHIHHATIQIETANHEHSDALLCELASSPSSHSHTH